MKRTNRMIALIMAIAMVFSLCTFAAAEEEVTRASLMETMAKTFAAQESPAEWVIFDLAAYGADISDAKKDAYIESAVAAVTKENAAITEFAKAEIILHALGVDTTKLEDAGGKSVSNPDNLHEITEFATYSDAIWTLFADELDSVTLTESQVKAAVTKIGASVNESGMIFGTYGDYTYDDPDSTGAAVGALSRLVDDKDTYGANEVYNKMLAALSSAQLENGSYGSACTDAFVIMGLCAAGIDADADARFVKGEASVIDGLMSYAVEGGLAGYDGNLDLAWSTEQGFRALIAYEGFVENDKAPFNIYSDAIETQPENGEEDESGEEEKQDPTTGGGLIAGEDSSNLPQTDTDTGSDSSEDNVETENEPETITVLFEMKTHKKTWMSKRSVDVEKNISVKNLIKKVFDENGVTSEGLDSGYLRSVTFDGETWGEFDAGDNSGWQYYVNGSMPRVGIASYRLKDGDEVSLVYTADYTTNDTESEENDSEENREETPTDSETSAWTNPFADVNASDWFISSVQFVHENGLMNGTTQTSFEPNGPLTRAMFVTVLYRMDGSTYTGEESFTDVEDGTWYSAAVAWASENEIVNGTSETTFAPNAPVTREQMAALAYRYAKFKGKDVSSDAEMSFSDADEISDYARDAASWANANGIMTGVSGKFNPAANSARCEAAAVFMRLYNVING